LYTADKKTTGTNNWGVEIVVNTASQDTKSLHFGDHFSGVVSNVTAFGAQGNSTVPTDGFVLSVQNKELASELSAVASGSTIDVNISIDEKWMDAAFILAAGPLLVKNGTENISMSLASSFASSRSPRTAVAVDATGTKVFLVTVDGRQNGHSDGVSLKDLASYLISKGAASAINLDGGGSTAMVVRNPGSYSATLVNKPSDGVERRVSAILQVVNTAPKGIMKSITLSQIPSEVLKGTSLTMQVASAYDEYFNPVTVNPDSMKWSVEGNIGTMNGATFTATTAGEGKIVGEYEGIRATLPVKVVVVGDQPMILDSFDDVAQWTSEATKANASITNSVDTARQGVASLKLTYDFTTSDTGTKAAYAVLNKPVAIVGQPNHIGVWVYGDGGKHWLRAMIIDGAGKKQTIDFTSQGGLDWSGWKYVTAKIPSTMKLPVQFDRLYIAQPIASLQNKGQVFFDQLQAVYSEKHQELVYTDVTKEHWAFTPIQNLYARSLIKGYANGSFKPDATITRAEAAVIIARSLSLKPTKTTNFSDVKSSHFAYSAISAVEQYGIIQGREAGKFNPDGKLTRAEMAMILTRAYNLKGTSTLSFKDVRSDHWAYTNIQILVANNLAGGFPDNTFKLDLPISRAQFATFLDRVK